MTPSPQAESVVAIFRSPLFNPTETFVTGHVAGLRRYRPIVVGLVRKAGSCPAGVRMFLPESTAERLCLSLGDCAGRFARRIAEERPLLIHAHFGTDGLIALPIAERLGIPLVTTLHGFDVSRRSLPMLLSGRLSWMRYALLKRRLFEQGALFLAVSDAVRDRALRAGYPPGRTFTLYNGVDTDYFTPAAQAPEPGLILHVGRLVEKKGTRLLIEALAAIAAAVPKASLVVIGDGPDRRRLERQARRLGLLERVQFLGALSPDAVRAWMRRAWLLAAPSITARDGDAEGLPTVICEAAAVGLPVVASAHSGIKEGVRDIETGFLVPEGDTRAMAARIIDLLENPGLRVRMASAARAFAEKSFSRTCQLASLEARYDSLLAQDQSQCA
jgi:colanic acid/amylovoran biosynthesis glycosyltransferase